MMSTLDANNEESARALRHLELIDGEAAEYGVRTVKLEDDLMAKKYGHRQPPGVGYFRQGQYVKYEGDVMDEEELLDWLTDPNVMEVGGKIERVNTKMFEKLKARNEYLAVLFCKSNHYGTRLRCSFQTHNTTANSANTCWISSRKSMTRPRSWVSNQLFPLWVL